MCMPFVSFCDYWCTISVSFIFNALHSTCTCWRAFALTETNERNGKKLVIARGVLRTYSHRHLHTLFAGAVLCTESAIRSHYEAIWSNFSAMEWALPSLPCVICTTQECWQNEGKGRRRRRNKNHNQKPASKRFLWVYVCRMSKHISSSSIIFLYVFTWNRSFFLVLLLLCSSSFNIVWQPTVE